MNPDLTPEAAGLFDDLTANLPVPPEPEEVVDEPELDPSAQALGFLLGLDNAPDPEEVEAWIERFGPEGVFLVRLAGKDVFVLRFINGAEQRGILAEVQKARQRVQPDDVQTLMAIDERMKFLVVSTCCLWHSNYPDPLSQEDFAVSRAGLLDQLSSVISINSYYFDNPQQILNFTVPLR